MNFKAIQKLEVSRRLTSGKQVTVGVLAQNKQGVFFQYAPQYLAKFASLSPFNLKSDNSVQLAPKTPHNGLHGVFSDALPDGWGLLLQDRIFRQQDILPSLVTAMDRLAFVGDTALGALSFSPVSKYATQDNQVADLFSLGINAQQIFDGQTDDVLNALVAAGSSGGARPKAQIYVSNNNFQECSTKERLGDQAWIVKFTSKNLALGHEEGVCEAVYLTLAKQAGLNPPEWALLNAPEHSGAKQWLAVKRFDHIPYQNQASGRYHMHSACGLLDADFRAPSLDYDDLIRASRVLCKSPAAGQLQFKRAIFNLFACNQDDHSKNWGFLQDDSNNWTLAPFFDITFSPTPFGEHSTAYSGFGKLPPITAIQKLAQSAGYARWEHAKIVVKEVMETVSDFPNVATNLGVSAATKKLITNQLESNKKALRKTLSI
ncbi:type II toxin-antitoxin system HipA family toxin [Paraglaciecola aquimarina]|uniref:Type II toxin-antitoxin system HipA family toxin n=1 Tax=Paraglaciecola algarum TaxID=3050085 RepID=A0ABS9D8Z1_9ALTE|nr:type II toxin-antitoxin system HipA family toxin [Paraglaciecola sp. G1-23]MCF2949437.1 type II toxin-antitoxin system HipA family toxin [Paraglaciecola sp. G1-23]